MLSVACLTAMPLAAACARSESPGAARGDSAAAPAAVQAAALALQAQPSPPEVPPLVQRAMRITVETTIQVDAFEPAMQRLRTAVEEHGGYVSDARVYFGERRSAALEARVPSARVGAFRAAVAAIGEVVADAEKAEDVTEQRADIGARLRNARAQEKRLLDLLSDRTGSLADVVAVEKQLGGVRETIEQIEAQERLLEGQIAYATVKISVSARHGEEAAGAGGKIARAARKGIENAGAFAVGSVVLLATAGPTLLLLAAFGAALYYALRGVVRRRAAASPGRPLRAGAAQPHPGAQPPAHGAPPACGPYAPQPQGSYAPPPPQDRDSNDLFPPADRAKIEALTEDPNAQVSYELTKGMLAWSDEMPRDVELSTIEKLVMLQSYRSMMYRPEEYRESRDELVRDWFAACRATWEKARASGLRWIGFAPSRTDPANLALLLELEKSEFPDM
jgi:hypothetical protein